MIILKKTKLLPFRSVLLMLLFIFFSLMVGAQTKFPSTYYSLKTNNEKAIFLKKLIRDSLSASAYKDIPAFTYEALKVASTLEKDTLTPLFYQYLADAYDGRIPDSAAYYYRASQRAYKKIPQIKDIYLKQSLLYVYSGLDKKDSILFYINELQNAIAKLPDTNKLKLNATNTLATSYEAVNNYEAAIKCFRFVIKNALTIKDTAILRNGFVNTGIAYNETDNNRMAIYYTQQAIPYLKDDEYSKMVTYANLSDFYTNLGILDSAKMYLQTATTIATNSGDDDAINSIGIRQANIYVQEKKFSAAEPLLQRGLKNFLGRPPGIDIVNGLLIYAGLDTARHDFIGAKKHLLQLYDITKGMGKAYQLENLLFLISVHERLGEYKDAFNYQRSAMAMNDSIRSEKVQQSFGQLQTEYETYKKEEQIKLLQQESKIKDLELKAALRNKSLLVILAIVLIAALLLILYIRNLRSKVKLQNLRSTLEMKALRSQMNPHFIFNSLNSIQKYIWENKQEDASEYLTKFARLIRLVLENSLHAEVLLSEELKALKLYIEMEHRRNNNKFDYSVTVADDVDVDKLMVPPLLLQPYVENAVWHGLSQKEGRGKLSILITKNNSSLICTIDDDGVGRAKATEAKMNKEEKKSLAMNISSERIAWLQKESKMPAGVEIIDKKENDIASGTTVSITLPLKRSND